MKDILRISLWLIIVFMAISCDMSLRNLEIKGSMDVQPDDDPQFHSTFNSVTAPQLSNRKRNQHKKETVINNEQEEEAESLSMDDLYEQLDIPVQEFVLDNNKDTTLISKGGLSMNIAANSFVYFNEKIILGEVVVSLKEYHSTADFVLGNLSTYSGTNQLESSGIFNLSAKTIEGITCKLKPKGKIELKMAVSDVAYHDMEVFYGSKSTDNTIDWRNSKKRVKTVGQDKIYANKEHISARMEVVEMTGEKIISQTSHTNDHGAAIYSSKEKIDTLQFEMVVNKDGQIKKTEVLLNGKIQPRSRPQIIEYKKGFLHITAGKSRYVENELNLKHDYLIELTGFNRYQHNFRLTQDFFKNSTYKRKNKNDEYRITWQDIYVANDTVVSKERSMYTHSSPKSDGHEIGYYTFAVTQLDWVNVGRYSKNKEARINMKATDHSQHMEVRMVFHNIKSVLTPNNGRKNFENIRMNKDVSFVAIKIEDNKPFLAIRTMKTQQGAIGDFDFRQMTVAELREKIIELF